MPFRRDPVSEQFDAAAARLISRAHDARPAWRGTYVANPGPEWIAWARANGIRLLGADTAAGGQARTRWCRAFVRSCYYLHKWHYYYGRGLDLAEKRNAPGAGGSLQFRVGSVRIGRGGVVVGRLVQIRLLEDGAAADAAVQQLPDSKRIFDDRGDPAGRWADPARRDWL